MQKSGSKPAEEGQELVEPADPYGMFQTHKVKVSGIAALELASQPEDHQAAVTEMLAATKSDLAALWKAEGLPEVVARYWRIDDEPWQASPPSPEGAVRLEACRHPAERAKAGSRLARSWEVWRALEELECARAEGDVDRAIFFAKVLAQKLSEIATARRHGRAFQVGDKTIGAGTSTARERFQDRQPMYEAWISRDKELRGQGFSQRARAKIIAGEGDQDPNTVRSYLRRWEKNSKKIVGTTSYVPKKCA